MANQLPTTERIRSLLSYDPNTGIFKWKVSNSPRARVGEKAGSINSSGYSNIQIDCKLWCAHRLAWKYVTSSDPVGQIDHIDGCKTNNVFANLRDVSQSSNLHNQRRHKTSFVGVTPHGRGFRAKITVNKKIYHLGTFSTLSEAARSYRTARAELGVNI